MNLKIIITMVKNMATDSVMDGVLKMEKFMVGVVVMEMVKLPDLVVDIMTI